MKNYIIRKKNPLAVYAGSLIQQNHGEDLMGHGYVIWNLKSKASIVPPSWRVHNSSVLQHRRAATDGNAARRFERFGKLNMPAGIGTARALGALGPPSLPRARIGRARGA